MSFLIYLRTYGAFSGFRVASLKRPDTDPGEHPQQFRVRARCTAIQRRSQTPNLRSISQLYRAIECAKSGATRSILRSRRLLYDCVHEAPLFKLLVLRFTRWDMALTVYPMFKRLH
jgi:hypothetical protein